MNCNHVVLKIFFFADLSATLSNTFCWQGFDWSVDKEVLLSDEHMYFYLFLFIFLLGLLKKLLFKIAEGSFWHYFTFIMMNLLTFIACFMFFVIFVKSWLICLEGNKVMGFRMFFKQIYLRNVLSRQADRLQEIAIFGG